MLFSKRIEPNCVYCQYGGRISDNEIICTKKGLVSIDGACHKFLYDPLRREPERPAPLKSDYSEEDFDL